MSTVIRAENLKMGRNVLDWPEGSQALSFVNDHGTPMVYYRRQIDEQHWISPVTGKTHGRHLVLLVRTGESMERMPGYNFVGTAIFDAGGIHCFHCDDSSLIGL